MIGGLFGLGLVGLFGALSSKGTQRLLGVAGAAIGLGGHAKVLFIFHLMFHNRAQPKGPPGFVKPLEIILHQIAFRPSAKPPDRDQMHPHLDSGVRVDAMAR